MRKTGLIQERNNLIYKEYSAEWATGIREEIIIKNLSNRFFLEESTIYRIILQQSKPAKATG